MGFSHILNDQLGDGSPDYSWDWEYGELRSLNRTTASGTTLRLVECEDCSHRYGYLVKVQVAQYARTGVGAEHSLEVAGKRARRIAEQQLEWAIDLAPCPNCGWIQDEMIPLARRRFLPWAILVGLILIGLSLLIVPCVLYYGLVYQPYLPFPKLALALSIVPAGLGVLLIISKFALAPLYDPNSASESYRIKQGKQRALKPKKLQKALEVLAKRKAIVDSQDG